MSSKQKAVITIEARMGSSRLPGKCDLPILDTTTTGFLVRRLRKVRYADEIVIATTTHPRDDVLEKRASELGVKAFRGSEEDVMSRVIGAAESVGAGIVVEVTGDCLLLDPRLLDEGIELYRKSGADVVANVGGGRVSYPQGMDLQVFSLARLKEAYPLATPGQREHVSLYFYENPSKFRIEWVDAPGGLQLSEWRLMLDYPDDYRLLRGVIEYLAPEKPDFDARDVVEAIRTKPEWLALATKAYER
ncbi:MAG: glycosyltransferase family protein [Verrucomicrobiae bacterium]|nr:glycosyltransferase family protein [Verrucomicrobiae bacterium]